MGDTVGDKAHPRRAKISQSSGKHGGRRKRSQSHIHVVTRSRRAVENKVEDKVGNKVGDKARSMS